MFSATIAPPSNRARQFAGAYQQVGVQTMVNEASPHGLVTLLFDGFFAAVNRARGAMRAGDPQVKGSALMQAVRIVDEGLKASLNLESGGKLAADLSDLYAYVCLRLTQANLRNDEKALEECLGLMSPLRDAWNAIGESADARARN
ncbi:flagellar export chaperone FliS [Aquincola sp. S2]|uniref:Flagellar secretion chaperone FliS n=1 Tax=Pseudaquabacterium terrae TaxID=2732868 RepID=A0ABX2ENT6_9BURK|nr:flagellar export chaperone FliS [Aquabacterium terrae]NRF70210.1 flagellar export chaperone FliS [Aquabacterium terrae]